MGDLRWVPPDLALARLDLKLQKPGSRVIAWALEKSLQEGKFEERQGFCDGDFGIFVRRLMILVALSHDCYSLGARSSVSVGYVMLSVKFWWSALVYLARLFYPIWWTFDVAFLNYSSLIWQKSRVAGMYF